MKPIIAILNFLFLIAGCSTQQEAEIPEQLQELENLIVYSDDQQPASNIQLIRERAFGADTDASMQWFEEVVGVDWFRRMEADDSGRVFIGNNRVSGIHVFDADGGYITQLGRDGVGPGEFQFINEMKIISNNLYVYDSMQSRVSVFSLDSLTLKKTISAYTGRVPLNVDEHEELLGWMALRSTFRTDGNYLVGYMRRPKSVGFGTSTYNLKQERWIKYYIADGESMVLSDKLFMIDDHEDITADVNGRHLYNLLTFPFLSRSIVKLSHQDYIYTAWTRDFLIKIYDETGAYLRALYYPFRPKELHREEAAELFDEGDEQQSRLLVMNAELPETWPALDELLVDDEHRIWVSVNIEDEEPVREWWVLETTGELVARFRWPDNRTIKAVKNGYLYALETDREDGAQLIVRYRVEMEEV